MKIGIDVSSLVYRRGVSRYTSNLLAALTQFPGQKLLVYGNSLRQYKVLEAEVRSTLKNTTPDKYDLYLEKFSPKLLTKVWSLGFKSIKKTMPSVEVFHSWDWLQPPDKNLPLVSTIHDLAMLKYPETAHPRVLKMHQASWKVLKKRQAEILTVSESSKKDIVEQLQIDPKKITVTYEALPQENKNNNARLDANPELMAKLKQELSLDKPYILFVGSREPRKNLERLIKAWLPLAKDYQLIMAGEKAWDESNTISTNPNLRFLGRVSDLKLAVLYHYAELLAYPSLDEGFGLPILEAFSAGLPVLSSDIPVIKEVTGNAAELVNPKSVDAIRQGLEKLLNEKKTLSQQRMQRMIIRSQLFNWQKTARQTLAVYQRAIENQS